MSQPQAAAPSEKNDVTIDFGPIKLTGSLLHDDAQRSLVLDTVEGVEPISVKLDAYSITPGPGNVFIKDWSEHSGLTARLTAAGLVKPVRTLVVGPFQSTAYEVQVTL
ncbi:hypothetical protein [Streptomyces sp. NPDC056061]|uniref:hypothetical protein n=1 Tax=Streptomyces sp. NPDC056061 TaxID=3345700 RepID=UPI0035D984C6